MTSADDFFDGWPGGSLADRPLDDATVERLLAGDTVTADLAPVSAAVRALREAAGSPVMPNAALRAQMAAGAFAGAPRYAYRNGTGTWRGRATTVLGRAGRLRPVTRLAAVVAGAAVLSVGAAGFAGTLPPRVQDRFETVVESVTPYRFAEKSAEPDDGSGAGDGSGGRGPAGGEPGDQGNGRGHTPPGHPPAGGPGGQRGNGPDGANGNGADGNPGNGNGPDGNSGNGNGPDGNSGNGNGPDGNPGNGNGPDGNSGNGGGGNGNGP